jgi:hypothetical protein
MSRLGAVLTLLLLFAGASAQATPFFARQYGMRCGSCHSGFPRLNEFGLAFKANNFRIPGAENDAILAWKKSIPLAIQVKPTHMRLEPPFTVEFTDTQLLAGGLLTKRTAFYVHHNYFFDAKPLDFPTWEVWIQHVLDDKNKIMLKGGQFELPWAYSPEINRTTISLPDLFFGVNVNPNDVALGAPMSGLQLSGAAPGGMQLYLAYGGPAYNSSGNTIGNREFFGRFRDLFVKASTGEPSRNIGAFAYLTYPPRSRTNPATEERAVRYGLDGTLIWKGIQFQGMAVYGKNADPAGTGKHGIMRGALLEADRMILPNVGVTARVDVAQRSFNNVKTYFDGKTIALRYYPIDNLKLIAEHQWLDHGRRSASIMAAFAF